MKTYEYSHNKIEEGISITQDAKFKFVALGGGDGEEPRKAILWREAPPKIEYGKIKHADLYEVKGMVKDSLALSEPEEESESILVRVDTSRIKDTSETNGEWHRRQGRAKVLFGAKGIRKNGVMFSDDIIQLDPFQSIIVKSEGEAIRHEIRNVGGKMIFNTFEVAVK